MPFSFGLSDELKAEIKILSKRDRKTCEILNKKIIEIANSDETTIEHYKNLRHDLKEYKRVHIAKSFVLLFKVFKKENFILFDKFRHHDDIYKK
ncbi:MAG: addiction module toxin RelE [Candidatus ainarchaeum sp.]|nr:addiction module toxin RelE [Candidatus ainarchaeum sp.]